MQLKIKNTNKKKILVLQGGGIRGCFETTVLKYVEQKLGMPICQRYDLIIGTSTGAIIGALLAFGVSATQINDIYVKKGRSLFKKFPWYKKLTGWNLPKYDRLGLIEQLIDTFKRHFGIVPFMGQSKTNLILTTFGRMSGRTHFIYSYDQRHNGLKIIQNCNSYGPIRWSALSAPFYFGQIVVPLYKWWEEYQTDNPGWQYGRVFQDGGVGNYNCPIRAGYQKAIELEWNNQDIQMLNIGRGEQLLRKNFNYVRDDWKLTQSIKYLQRSRDESTFDQIKSVKAVSNAFKSINFQRISPVLNQKMDQLDALEYVNDFVKLGQEYKLKIRKQFLQK